MIAINEIQALKAAQLGIRVYFDRGEFWIPAMFLPEVG